MTTPTSQHLKIEIRPTNDDGKSEKPNSGGFFRQLFGRKFLFDIDLHKIDADYIRSLLFEDNLSAHTSTSKQSGSNIEVEKKISILQALLREAKAKRDLEISLYGSPTPTTTAEIARLEFEIEQLKKQRNKKGN